MDTSGRLHVGDQPFAGGEQVTPSDGAGGIALTPNDDADITAKHRALWIGPGGTISAVIMDADGATRRTIATTVGDGSIFPFRVLRLSVAGTTASGIVAGW
ncbi:MAG: hypothetical protein ACMG6S_15710 [Byssovorax sp.]